MIETTSQITMIHQELDSTLPTEVRREYIITRLTAEYERCVKEYRHDSIAWNRLSYWLYYLNNVQQELQNGGTCSIQQ